MVGGDRMGWSSRTARPHDRVDWELSTREATWPYGWAMQSCGHFVCPGFLRLTHSCLTNFSWCLTCRYGIKDQEDCSEMVLPRSGTNSTTRSGIYWPRSSAKVRVSPKFEVWTDTIHWLGRSWGVGLADKVRELIDVGGWDRLLTICDPVRWDITLEVLALFSLDRSDTDFDKENTIHFWALGQPHGCIWLSLQSCWAYMIETTLARSSMHSFSPTILLALVQAMFFKSCVATISLFWANQRAFCFHHNQPTVISMLFLVGQWQVVVMVLAYLACWIFFISIQWLRESPFTWVYYGCLESVFMNRGTFRLTIHLSTPLQDGFSSFDLRGWKD